MRKLSWKIPGSLLVGTQRILWDRQFEWLVSCLLSVPDSGPSLTGLLLICEHRYTVPDESSHFGSPPSPPWLVMATIQINLVYKISKLTLCFASSVNGYVLVCGASSLLRTVFFLRPCAFKKPPAYSSRTYGRAILARICSARASHFFVCWIATVMIDASPRDSILSLPVILKGLSPRSPQGGPKDLLKENNRRMERMLPSWACKLGFNSFIKVSTRWAILLRSIDYLQRTPLRSFRRVESLFPRNGN